MTRLKFILSFIMLNCATLIGFGQVTIQLNPVVSNSFSSTDIWNMGVQYLGQTPVTVRFVGRISDERGKPLVNLISSNVLLQPGLQLFNKNTLLTSSLNYQNPYAGNYEKTSGQLPPGKLQYCVYVECMETPDVCIQKLNPENLQSSCQTIDLQPPTPLLLASPDDEAKIKIKRPNFSWIPPMPIGQNPDLKYEMTLVKMNKKQKAEDAIIRNRPLYKEAGLAQTFMPFPTNLSDLEVGEKYAWTVKAFLGDIFITQAEVWEFEVIEEIINNTFYRLSTEFPKEVQTHKLDVPLNISYNLNYKLISMEDLKIKIIIDGKEVEFNSNESKGLVKFGYGGIGVDFLSLGAKSQSKMTIILSDKKNYKQYLVLKFENEK